MNNKTAPKFVFDNCHACQGRFFVPVIQSSLDGGQYTSMQPCPVCLEEPTKA